MIRGGFPEGKMLLYHVSMREELARALAAAGATIRQEQRPGDVGALLRLHGILYAAEHGYSLDFEGYVAKTLAACSWPLAGRQRLWLVESEEALRGAVAIITAEPEVAQLRWLLLDATLRGHGLGRALVQESLDFCRREGYSSVLLWTEGSLAAATGLYKSLGFRLTETRTSDLWGATRTEERYDLALSEPARS
jgi:GNAT superfamily N-acetyltransferase